MSDRPTTAAMFNLPTTAAMSNRPTTAGGPLAMEFTSPLDALEEAFDPDVNPFAFGPPTAPPTAQQDRQPQEQRQETAVSYMPELPLSAALYLKYNSPISTGVQPSPGGADSLSTALPDRLFSRVHHDVRGGTTSSEGDHRMRRRKDWVTKVGEDVVYTPGIRPIMFTPTTPGNSVQQGSKTPSSFGDEIHSVKMEIDLEVFDDEDSPYPEVRASVSNIDDPEMPAMTIRMWIIAILLCLPASAANVFFAFRSPTVEFEAFIPLLLCYPIGKFFAAVLPIKTFRVPLPRPFTSFTFTLNPGPWNIKEHTLVFIMGNTSLQSSYTLKATTVLQHYYGFKPDFWFNFLFGVSAQFTGFAFAGMCRRLFVTPSFMIWPQTLTVCTLLNALHAEEDHDTPGMTRYRYFLIICLASFFFFFLPGYLFQALSVFSFICWIKPNNVVVNQLFGANTGLGLNFLTFDWLQISWIGSPLITPWWAEVHLFSGFVFFYCIILPILYYTNVWQLAHFPILGSSVYDRFGKKYDYQRILTPDLKFNETAYNEYSPIYLSGVFVVTYYVAFAISANIIVHAILYHGKTILAFLREDPDGGYGDIHAKLMRSYPTVPIWWYIVIFVAGFVMQTILTEMWHLGVPVWMFMLIIAVLAIFIIPSTIILALTTLPVASVNLPLQIMSGALFPGNPAVNIVCKGYGVMLFAVATGFPFNLKLCHYMKIPPRSTFIVQLAGVIMAMLVQVAVQQLLFSTIPNICTPQAPNGLVCPHLKIFFTASIVWGTIGPGRLFGPHARYRPELSAILVGALLPIPFWLWQLRHPRSWVRYVSTPVFLAVAFNIPPATGINYTSWFLVGFIFQYLIRKKNFTWWLKYNYMTSIGLDIGTSISILTIFFAFYLRTKPIEIDWWGNNVFLNTADFLGTPFRPLPSGKPLPWSTSS